MLEKLSSNFGDNRKNIEKGIEKGKGDGIK